MNKRVLIVEDNLDEQNIYKEILEKNGFIVETASDGEEGLHKAEKGGFALILLDIMLPRMDGLEVMSHLKNSQSRQKNGPVVFLSNLTHDLLKKQTFNLGAATHLLKTDVTPGKLVEIVKTYAC